MPNVTALISFDHFGKRKRNESFFVSDAHALSLARAGLVKIEGDSNPQTAISEVAPSSVSEVVQVSQAQTFQQFVNGVTPKRRGRPPKQ